MSKTSSARQEAMTLAEFDVAVDQHAGTPQMFAATVRGLHECRAQAAAVQEARSECFERMKTAHAIGDRVAGEYVLDRRADSAPTTKLVVPAAVIKKHSPTLWGQCRVPVPYVQAKAPATVAAVAVESLPSVSDKAAIADVVAVYQQLGSRLAQLRDTETDLVDRLKKIGANNGWDGLPIEFADGWKVSLIQLQYSSDRLAEVAPETFACLAQEVTSERAGTVYLRRAGGADGAELDGE